MAGFEIMDLFRDVRQAKVAAGLQEQRQAGITELLGSAGTETRQPLQPGQVGPPEINRGVGASGLLADPEDLRRQVAFAGGLEGLQGGAGSGLLGQVLGQAAQSERQAGVNTRADQSDIRDLAQDESQFARTLAENVRQFDNPQETATSGNDRRAEVTANRAAEQARINDPFLAFNPLTMGQPGGGAVRVDPKQFAAQQSAHDTTTSMQREANRAMELIDEFGSEIWNADAVGEFVNIRANLLLRSSGLRGAGAPQGAELEISGKGLPDPQSLFNNLTAPLRIGERDKWAAAYKSFGGQIGDSVISQLGVNPTLASDLDGMSEEFLTSRGITPDMWEFFKESRGQRIE